MKLTKTVQNRLILIAAFAVSFGVVLTLASFFDLEIDKALYTPESFFGQVFSNLGEIPSYLVAPVAGVIFYRSVDENDRRFLLIKILSGIVMIVGNYFLLNNIFSNLANPELLYQPAYLIVFAAAVSILSVLGTAKADKRVMRKLALFALFLVLVAAFSQGIVWILKHAAGRLRFRNMVDGAGFTPWWQFQWGSAGREGLIAAGSFQPEDAFKSFPSGHSANSAILFTLVFLPNIFPKLKKLKPFFFGFAIVWTLLVMLARLVVGAHFLSDVLVGASVTLTVTAVAKWIIEYVYKKRGLSMSCGGDPDEPDNKSGSVILAVELPAPPAEQGEAKPEIQPETSDRRIR